MLAAVGVGVDRGAHATVRRAVRCRDGETKTWLDVLFSSEVFLTEKTTSSSYMSPTWNWSAADPACCSGLRPSRPAPVTAVVRRESTPQ